MCLKKLTDQAYIVDFEQHGVNYTPETQMFMHFTVDRLLDDGLLFHIIIFY
jgi:hypothetical protein